MSWTCRRLYSLDLDLATCNPSLTCVSILLGDNRRKNRGWEQWAHTKGVVLMLCGQWVVCQSTATAVLGYIPDTKIEELKKLSPEVMIYALQ